MNEKSPSANELAENISQNVRDWRNSKGWTIAELALRIGRNPAYVEVIEMGRGTPGGPDLYFLAKTFGTTMEKLLGVPDLK